MIKKIITNFAAILMTACVFAQSPNKMSYQAVIRNTSNSLVANSAVGMRISILQTSPSGPAVYAETQTPVSNANGLVSIEIGSGTLVSGNFNNIDWANGPYFVKTETDPTGGTSYTITGTSQLLSVPYALYAEKSGDSSLWSVSGNSLYYNSGSVGIGTSNPTQEGLTIQSNASKLNLITDGTNTNSQSMINYQIGNNKRWVQSARGINYTGEEGLFKTAYFNGNSWLPNIMVIDTLGQIGIGNSAPSVGLDIVGEDYASSRIAISRYQNNSAGGGLNIIKSRGNKLAPSPVLSGDGLGAISFCGYNGVNYNYSAGLVAVSTENFTSTSKGSKLVFLTTNNGSTSITEKMVINESGNVGIGTAAPVRTLHVNAVMRLEPIAVAPINPAKGDMYFDSIMNKLRVYDGTVWQACW